MHSRLVCSWSEPQLTKLVDQPPDGPEWLHEIKFDGYRVHARLDRGILRLLTRTGRLHWRGGVAPGATGLSRRRAAGVGPDGSRSFSLIRNASDTDTTMHLF